MRKVRWASWLGAVAMLVLLSGPAVADVASDRAAAIVDYPHVIMGGPLDTVIQLSNTSNEPVNVHCFYLNGNRHCSDTGEICSEDHLPPGSCSGSGAVCLPPTCNETDFWIRLTPRQPIGWLLSEGKDKFELDGRLMVGVGGSSNVGSRIPPAPEDPFVGELRCVVVDDSGTPIDWNVLKGEATIVRDTDPLDVNKYNAVGIQAIEGAVNGDRELVLGGPEAEYNGCPNVLILNHFFDHVEDPVNGDPIQTKMVLVPCEQDLYRQIPASTVVQYLVYNEFEQRFSTSRTVMCRQDLLLSSIDTTQEYRSIFSAGVAGTVVGQTRLSPLQGGLLGVVVELHDFDNPPTSASFNMHYQGDRLDPDVMTIP